MLKIHLITQNEPFYIPKMIKHLLHHQGKDYKINSYTVLKPSRKNKTFKHWFKERAKIYSWLELFIVGSSFIYTKVVNLLKGENTSYNSYKILQKAGIRHYPSNDINSKDYIQQISDLNPDIIVSISCPQLFGKDLLKVPNRFCVNAHGTLLPRHRGVFGSFWTLYHKDKEAGATLHTMELKLDAGEILWQKSFEVHKDDTQFSIAYKTKKIMAEGLVELFEESNKNIIKPIKPYYKSSYHKAPSKKDGKELKQQGHRIVTLSNLKLMLAKSF